MENVDNQCLNDGHFSYFSLNKMILLNLRFFLFLDLSEVVGIQGNHLRLQFLQQTLDLSLLALALTLVRIEMHRVDVWISRPGYHQTGDALRRSQRHRILKRTKLDIPNKAPLCQIVHVRDSLLVFCVNVSPDRNMGTASDGQQVPLAKGKRCCWLGDAVLMDRLVVVSQVPDLRHPVQAGRRHVLPRAVDGDCGDFPTVAEHLDERVCDGGRPHADDSPPVPQMDNGVLGVLCHGAAGPKPRLQLPDQLASARVLVAEGAGVSDGGEQEMELQVFKTVGLDVPLQLVNFEAVLVVDEKMLLLGNCKQRLIVQPMDVSDPLPQQKFASQPSALPVECGDVPLVTAHQQVSAVWGEVDGVWAVVQGKREMATSAGDGDVFANVELADLICFFILVCL